MRVITYLHVADQVKAYRNLKKDLYYSEKRLTNGKARNYKQWVTKGLKNLYNKLLIGLK